MAVATLIAPNISPTTPLFSILEFSGSIEVKFPYKLSEDQFYSFCVANSDLQIEQDKHGKIIIISPVGFESGVYEAQIIAALGVWLAQEGQGIVVSSATGFRLPDGSTYSPDASWISQEKVESLTSEQRKKFPPVVPDFVVEIRSESDRLARLKRKMTSVWIKNGVRLAWLLDPKNKKTIIYRVDGTIEILEGFDHVLSGEDVCKGFEFDLRLFVL